MKNLVKKYLDLVQYPNSKNEFEEAFLSHPNYPSIYAITDTLNLLEIENIAVKVPKDQFIELPDLFMAVFKENIVLVHKTISSVLIEDEKGKINLYYNDFLNGWDGIIVFIEPNPNVFVDKKLNYNISFKYIFPFIALIGLSIIFNQNTINDYILLTTSIIGFIISVFIIQEKLGIKNEIASKICNITPNASCNEVIKSSESYLNRWVSLSDLPLLFFSTNVLSILILPQQSSFVIGFLSLLSIPVLLYSVWVQKFQIKKWCILCLSVAIVIAIQSIYFSIKTTFNFLNLNFTIFSAYLFSMVLLSSIWFFVKPVLEIKLKAELEVNELKKFKRNFSLFTFLCKEIPNFNDFAKLEGIHFGNKNADLQLTTILSPSCGHCHKAFDEGLALALRFPERISFTVLFNLNPENNDNPYKIVVETLLTLNNLHEENAKLALIDWHSNNMEFDFWIAKWKKETIDMKANQQIFQQYNWCSQNDFNHTPVKLINQKIFPTEYDISELKYFITNFSEKAEIENQTVLEQA